MPAFGEDAVSTSFRLRQTRFRLTRLSETTRGIAVNGLLSWTVWPLVLPPFRLYSGRELLEILLWQVMGLVGWPLGLVGGLANLLLHRAGTDLVSLLLTR